MTADLAEICSAITDSGVERLPFSDRHMIALSKLPLLHRDPFDRMLIAQSQSEEVALLSADTQLKQYDCHLVDARALARIVHQ